MPLATITSSSTSKSLIVFLASSAYGICASSYPFNGNSMRADHGAESLIRQDFEQQHVGHATVDDVHRVHAALGGIQRPRNFGQHAAADGAIDKQLVNALGREIGHQHARLVEHTADVGEHHEFFGLQHGGQLGGHHVGIDVVTLVVFAKADRADDGDERIVLQRLDHAGVHADDVTHLAHIVFLAGVLVIQHLEFAREDHGAVAPGQAHRLAASLVDQAHDVLLHLAAQHPLHHVHGGAVGHAHALDELALHAQALERTLDLRATTVHHHRVDAHQLEQHHVLGKGFLQDRIRHGVAAILDDHGLAVELADVGQGLGQDLGFVKRGDGGGGSSVGHEEHHVGKGDDENFYT